MSQSTTAVAVKQEVDDGHCISLPQPTDIKVEEELVIEQNINHADQCHKPTSSSFFDCRCLECLGAVFVKGERILDTETIKVEDEEKQTEAQAELNHSTIVSTNDNHETDLTGSASTAESLPVTIETKSELTIPRSANQVVTRLSDEESEDSDDQLQTAQTETSTAEPTQQTRKRTLLAETDDSRKRAKPTTYRCTFEGCDRVYQSRNGYNHHQTAHSGKFTCTQCGKSCQSNVHLTQHQRTHSGEKPFKCTHCDKSFARSNALTVHLRTHTGERPYKCLHCALAFADKSNLLAHLRLHSGQLPYQCEQCMKRFNQKGQLTSHVRAKH